MSEGDPKLGTVLNGTYRLEAVLGTGGMGTVYLARHVHLGTEYAVKSLVPQFTDNEEAVKRFQREAQISSQLGHPNIVHVLDFNYDSSGTPYMVMDLLRGETLRARLSRLGKLGLHAALPIVRQLCEGLGAAHELGVVHRDLKPENLFLCNGSDQLKVLDFGVSKIRGTYNTQLTRPMAMLGTPYYMSPEQASGNTADVDALSDVWAVGAIIFEMLTGKGAFAADNPVAVFYKIVNDPFPQAAEHGADVPRAVDRVLAKACSKVPSDRYATTRALFDELQLAAMATDQTRPLSVPEARARLGMLDQPTQLKLVGDEDPTPAVATDPRRLASLGDDHRTPPPLAEQDTRLFAGADAKTPAPLPAQPTQILMGDGKGPAPLPAQPTQMLHGSKEAPRAARGSLADLPTKQTLISPSAEPFLDEDELTHRAERPSPPLPNDRTAQVALPSLAPTAVKLPAQQNTTPVAAGESRARRRGGRGAPRWPLFAAGAFALFGVSIAAWTVSHGRQVEARAARARLDEAVAKGRWEVADLELRAITAEGGGSPDLAAIAARVAGEKRASDVVRAARDLRVRGDLVGAAAELAKVDPKSGAAAEAAKERDLVARGWEADLERALHERRCAEAASFARKLVALDQRAMPPSVSSCRDAPSDGATDPPAPPRPTAADAARAYKRREFDRALGLAQQVVKADPWADAAWWTLGTSACALGNAEEARRARARLARKGQAELDKLCRVRRITLVEGAPPRTRTPEPPPLEASGMLARETMMRMLATAEPIARKCFARARGYMTPMKVRVTAFPGSERFVATAISTGPIEIRSCLEALFASTRPPTVSTAVSAERVYGPTD